MASKASTIEFIVDQIAKAGNIRYRKMFGEYAIYCNEKVVAFVCDDKLFVKPNAEAEKIFGHPADAPPYPDAKNYFLVPDDKIDDTEFLTNLIEKTALALPLPKPIKK